MGDGGHNVSGGQRQRISIARELFKDAKLLIFDEATSALDSRSEREVQANIDEFQGQKTVVVIAHRLSTVKNSDLIFVLREGEVVESGPYEELYALGGEFTSMVDQQALTIERDPQRSVASRGSAVRGWAKGEPARRGTRGIDSRGIHIGLFPAPAPARALATSCSRPTTMSPL